MHMPGRHQRKVEWLFLHLGVLLSALLSTGRAQQPQPAGREFIAFRVDDRHVIAVMAELHGRTPDQSGIQPAAQYGFPYRDADAAAIAAIPPSAMSVKRWVVHLPGGRRVNALTDRAVQGSPSCSSLAGLLLTIEDPDRAMFASVREKYFVAEPQPPAFAAGPPRSAAVPPPIDRPQLDALLKSLLDRELPRVREEAAEEIDRMAASTVGYHRRWAEERRRFDAALTSGQARVVDDVQPFYLQPGGPPYYFVRAEWRVGSKPAFGAALWIKGGPSPSVAEANVAVARWLRMFEFQGRTSQLLYGQVLGVFDIDGDGWGEVLMAGGGYESTGLDVRALTPKGFVPMRISYSYGC
jgi:hypothetical protein